MAEITVARRHFLRVASGGTAAVALVAECSIPVV